MNNDVNKNVLQYSNELQKITQEVEQNLLKIQNDKIKEFRNHLNNISNNCISDIQLLINQTHSKINLNFSKNKIDDTVLDEFQFNVQAIILQAKNDLDTYKNQFDINVFEMINDETLKLKKFIKDNHGIIESELHDALYQINQSENSALNRLEETYDLGVETIVSAERTALHNLKILAEELSLKLEGKVEEIEKVIGEKLQNALDKIKEMEDKAIANITKLEITIKSELQNEKDKIIAELQKLIDDFNFRLESYVEELKAELTAHKDKLLEEITLNKEELIIELEKIKNGIIETLREREYEIIQNLNNREQEIIAEIIAVVEGYDLELEIIKNAKIKEFTETLNLLKEQFLKESIDLIEDCLNELKNSTEIHKEELVTATSVHLIELREACLVLIEKMKQDLKQKTDESLEQLENKKNEINVFLDNVKETAKQELNEYKEECKIDMENKKEELVQISKNEIQEYIEKFRENTYSVTIDPKQNNILVPASEMVLNRSLKLYFDGVLQTLNKHYTINFLNNSVTILEPFNYSIDVMFLQNLPVTNLPKREATDSEIDELFKDPYRLGTNKDIDSLYKIKSASDKDVDLLFIK